MTTTSLKTVFQDASKRNPGVMILGMLDSTQPSSVDKMVREANLKRMSQVAEEITQTARSLTDRVQSQKAELFSEDERSSHEILRELRAQIDGKLPAIKQALNPSQRGSLELWKEKVDGYMHAGQDSRTVDRQLIFCHKFNVQLDAWHDALNPPAEPPADPEVQTPLQRQAYEDAIAHLKRFAIDESLTARFQAIVLPDASGIEAQLLQALHLSQQQSVGIGGLPAFRQHANANIHNFSLERFRQAEELVFQRQLEADLHLNLLWDQIAARVHPGLNPPQTAAERRAWMNDVQNRASLAQVTDLQLIGFSRLPPEIEKLQRLTTLLCLGNENGRLTELPPQLANLPHLYFLLLVRNAFQEIPEVLERLPACLLPGILDNQNPITVFPEAIARKYANRWWMHLLEATWRSRGCCLDGVQLPAPGSPIRLPSTLHYLGLHPEAMTDIPFCMWLRDYFSLPYIPVVFPILFITGCLHNCFEFVRDNCWEPLAYLLKGVLYALSAISILLGVLINLPIFLLNLGMHWYIEPVISAFRSCLGYAPMIHYDPQPAPAQ